MIYLEKVYLSNWYGFTDEMIPFNSGSTFITGENESGKSTILDAIKYAFMADTQFNKGAAVTGEKKRTLASYTRCLYNATENLYARNEDVIFSHVFLGWYDDEAQKHFATGCVIRTKKEDTSTHWFIVEENIENIQFKKVVGNSEFVMSAHEFKTINGKNCKIYDYDSWMVAKENFMYRLGLHMTSSEIDKYRDEMRHMVTYKAGSMKITEFIKEFVLKDDPVNVDNLITSKQKYDELKANMDKLEEEAEKLKVMKEQFDKCTALERKKQVNDHKILLDSCREKEIALAKSEKTLQEVTGRARTLEKDIQSIDTLLESIRSRLSLLEAQRRNGDGAEQIESLNNQIRATNLLVEQAKADISHVERLYYSLIELTNGFDDIDVLDFTSDEISATDKEQYVINLRAELYARKAEFEAEKADKENKISEVNNKIRGIDAEIASLRNNVQVYDNKAVNAIKLRNAINKRLENDGRKGRAYLASELVVELTDDSWRNALEAYVGNNRYSVLVEPSDYKIASTVQREVKLPHARLINTTKLDGKKLNVHESSVMKYMRIENDVAYKYFAYLLGNTHEATHETAFDHTPSLCKDLYYTRELFSDYLEPVRIACMGIEAKRLNLQRKENEKAKILKELEPHKDAVNDIAAKIRNIVLAINKLNISVNFGAYETFATQNAELTTLKTQVAEMELAIQNNSFYFKLKEQIDELRGKETELMIKRNALTKEQGSVDTKYTNCISTVEALKLELTAAKNQLFENERLYPDAVAIAVSEHKKFWESKSDKKHSYDKPEEIATKLGVAKERLHKSELEYIKIYGAVVDANHFETLSTYEGFQVFIERLNLLEIDKIQEAKRKADEEQKNLNGIFKEQFVSEIYNKILSAQKKLRTINKELGKMSFNTEYQFVQDFLKDGSDFATIIEYAKESQKLQETQVNVFDTNNIENEKFEKLSKKIIALVNKMTVKNADKSLLSELSDYRNYLVYDIMQTDKTSGQKGYLSKESGYNSGAGTQIPYTIILAVALVMEYNREEGESTVRLIMLDEPFEKMSSENVKKTMELFKELKLQAIFCGASKMDSIGENCKTVIPVLKLSKKQMTVGSVEVK